LQQTMTFFQLDERTRSPRPQAPAVRASADIAKSRVALRSAPAQLGTTDFVRF